MVRPIRKPENTTRRAQQDPMGMLAELVAGGGSNAILNQEARGQKSFVESDTLPAEMSDSDKAALEAAGVKFLGPVPNDDLFLLVELPPGWKKVSIDHSMWSNLVDEKGCVRAQIFYKAAFYDRSAFLRLS